MRSLQPSSSVPDPLAAADTRTCPAFGPISVLTDTIKDHPTPRRVWAIDGSTGMEEAAQPAQAQCLNLSACSHIAVVNINHEHIATPTQRAVHGTMGGVDLQLMP